nr:hypothetical protein SHINE37_41851 [Rhizobiaceae bacterium]
MPASTDALPRPALLEYQLFQRQALPPSLHRQFRLAIEPVDEADAEPGNDLHMLGDAEDRTDVAVVEDADPADAHAFRPRRQPQVLHGADRGINIHARIVRAAEHHRAAASRIAGDADRQRRLQDALELQRAILRLPLPFEHRRRLAIGLQEGRMHRQPCLSATHQQEVPRLHEADGRGVVGGLQQAADEIVRQRIGQELVAHVAARFDGTVDGLPFLAGKGARPDQRVQGFASHRHLPNNASRPAAVRAVRSIVPGRSSDFGSRGRRLPSRLNNQWQKLESIQAFMAQTIPVTALGTFRT